jgi:hypothetical protein
MAGLKVNMSFDHRNPGRAIDGGRMDRKKRPGRGATEPKSGFDDTEKFENHFSTKSPEPRQAPHDTGGAR